MDGKDTDEVFQNPFFFLDQVFGHHGQGRAGWHLLQTGIHGQILVAFGDLVFGKHQDVKLFDVHMFQQAENPPADPGTGQPQ